MSTTDATPDLAPLAAALARAQARVVRIDHDATNTFHKYRYTSAEAVLSECKAALNAEGLSVSPVGGRLVYRDGAEHPTLERRFLLLHTSGASLTLETAWPAVPDRGRPLDKAVASAATTSLAYLLRDLLLAPRVDPDDDLAGREDREPARPAKPAAKGNGKPAADSNAPIGEQGLARLRTYCDKRGWPMDGPSGWLEWLGWHPSRPFAEITQGQAKGVCVAADKLAAAAKQRQAPPPAQASAPAPAGPIVTVAQVDELRAELARTGKGEDSVYRLLRHNPTPAGLAGLTQEQWQTVMDRVTRLPAAAAPAPTP